VGHCLNAAHVLEYDSESGVRQSNQSHQSNRWVIDLAKGNV
jgi:hypothetical protein